MGRNLSSTLKFKQLTAYTATSTAAVTSTGIDTSGYDSVLCRLSITAAGATTAHTLHAEMSATTATGDFVDIEGSEVVAATTGVCHLVCEVYKPQQRYVRFILSPSATVVVEQMTAILGAAQDLPEDVNQTSVQSGELVCGASTGTP